MPDLKVGAIVQARMGSSRLPGKVIADVVGKPLVIRVLERIMLMGSVDEIVLAKTGCC